MDINAEVSTQLSLIDVLLSDFDKTIAPCASKKNEKKEEETQDAMPDSTTNTEKNVPNPFQCGDDVLVPNKDGRYYLGTIVELSTSNDNDSCEVGSGEARCLVKFGDGTHSWAPVATLKLLSAPPADDGRIMCVVCKQREGPPAAAAAAAAEAVQAAEAAASPPRGNAVIACDMCGRGYHAKCHSPPVDAWINGASWHCKRCVDQRYRVAAAENRALKRTDFFRFKGNQRRQHQEMTPPCDTASTTSSAPSEENAKDTGEKHCYCGEKSDWLAQMLLCCRCSRWFHQRCVTSLQYPLYAGDKLYIFACAECNGGSEYLRRLELCWLALAQLALYNLTAYNAPNYFDLDSVVMPYILDNWHALQLPDKMWRTPARERRDKVLTALTASRKRFKCGREMKKRATIWGLRLRRPPSPPPHLALLDRIKKGTPLTDELVREYAPRLRFLPRSEGIPPTNGNKSSYKTQNQQNQRMIVPVDGHWLNLMMGKRFHENLNSNSNSEDSTSSYESTKLDEPRPADHDAKEEEEQSPPPPPAAALPSSTLLDNKSKDDDVGPRAAGHDSRIANMNIELSKLSTKNIIEHSKILSLQHMGGPGPGRAPPDESSGDDSSSRGTLDAFIPPPKDFQGKNNPFLMGSAQPAARLARQSLPCPLPCPLHAPPHAPPRTVKRKLCEKDIVIGPNGEVKRKKFRRPKKYLQMQLNKSCPLPEDSSKSGHTPTESGAGGKLPARRLRQRSERRYFEPGRRNPPGAPPAPCPPPCPGPNCSVRSLQLSPHKAAGEAAGAGAGAGAGDQLSALKSSVQSYFRRGQTFRVLARRLAPGAPPAFLIQWDSAAADT